MKMSYFYKPQRKRNRNLIKGDGFCYEKLKKLGEGTYGVVYKARDLTLDSKPNVAIKKIFEAYDNPELGLDATTVREISLLQEISHHRNIITLNRTIFYNNNIYLEFEFCDCDLKKFLKKNADLLYPIQIKYIIYQLFTGIEYLHQQRIMHRDIKPENILINKETLSVKIADFGLARTFSLGHLAKKQRGWTHEVVTLWYRSPEILLGDDYYLTSVDIWSIACIFVEIINKGQVLFPGDSEIDQLYKVFNVCGCPNENNYPSANKLRFWSNKFPKMKQKLANNIICDEFTDKLGIDLLSRILVLDPTQRISAKQALRHPYFNEVTSSK